MIKPSHDTASYIANLMAIDKSGLPNDGGQNFNRLIFAQSPYLLQHAENPVDWHEWGQAAFDKAQQKNLPMLLSIGYSTCHWCHVMAHESFEDREVASFLNQHFVCIKVDREERPDIDDFYMTVSQLMTGSGGWPLNVFMKPDKSPFMAITYLPKRSRNGMSGLLDLLENISSIWQQRPVMIENNCRAIMEELGNLSSKHQTDIYIDITATSENAFNQLEKIYDIRFSGFGNAPKFPMPIYLNWLIEQGRDGNARAYDMAFQTLRQMRSGGIWDQLGGGLHRYSVDRQWLTPHFEKMLYDQAMLATVSIKAFLACKDVFFSDMALEIFSFVNSVLKTSDGVYCSAIDADSEGEEGKFYVWSKSEIDECLQDQSQLFCSFFDASPTGNFEGVNILNIPMDLTSFCEKNRLSVPETAHLLEDCRKALLERRTKRIAPLRDDKIITSWNGLMIAALSMGGVVFENRDYIEQAATAAHFILRSLRRPDGRLLRSYLGKPSSTPAFLEDYAFFTYGLLELYEATLEQQWLDRAQELAEEIIRLFKDPNSGNFTMTGHDAEQMPVQASSDHDGVTPSALAITSTILMRLSWINDNPYLLEQAKQALKSLGGELKQNPISHLGALSALKELGSEPVIACFSEAADNPSLLLLLRGLKQSGIPNVAIRINTAPGLSQLSICANRTCYPPVTQPDQLLELLLRITA